MAGRKRDVIVVGGGHNALTAAAYLSKQGLDVTLLERRHILGGAAVTEEIVPGFKFSRASYLAGLMRPSVISELGLERHGFEYLEAETAELQEASRPRLHRVDGGQAPSQAFALSAMLFRRTDG